MEAKLPKQGFFTDVCSTNCRRTLGQKYDQETEAKKIKGSTKEIPKEAAVPKYLESTKSHYVYVLR